MQAKNNTETNKITLFLMTEKGYDFLVGTIDKYKNLFHLVIIGNDKSIDNDFEQEIIELCLKKNIRYKLKKDYYVIDTEYVIAIAWRWIIDHKYEKLIIFHDSILPKYRGFAPLVNSLINGENEIGVTAILGAKDYDTGAIIAQSKSRITYPLKIYDAIKINMINYIACANIVFEKIINSEDFVLTNQDQSEASYSLWLDDEDYIINWEKSSDKIIRFINSVGYPYKGAKTYLDKNILIIKNAIEVQDVLIQNRHAGKVLYVEDGHPVVVCGEGLIKIIEAYIQNNDETQNFFPLSKFRIRFKNNLQY